MHDPTKILMICALLLAGCSSTPDPLENEPEPVFEEISIRLDSDANNASATAIDLLLIYDYDLLKTLMKMSSGQYFGSIDQLKSDYPSLIDVVHWELTPGQTIKDHAVPLRSEIPVGALLFADYSTPGPHRLRIGESESINVRLRRQDFCIIEQGCPPLIQAPKGKADKSDSMASTLKLRDPLIQNASPQERASNLLNKMRSAEDRASDLVSLSKTAGLS